MCRLSDFDFWRIDTTRICTLWLCGTKVRIVSNSMTGVNYYYYSVLDVRKSWNKSVGVLLLILLLLLENVLDPSSVHHTVFLTWTSINQRIEHRFASKHRTIFATTTIIEWYFKWTSNESSIAAHRKKAHEIANGISMVQRLVGAV